MSRRDSKGGAMFLFEVRFFAPKGKNREPGLQAFSVRKMTGRRIPPLPFFSAYFALLLRSRSLGYLGLRPFTVYARSLRPRPKTKYFEKLSIMTESLPFRFFLRILLCCFVLAPSDTSASGLSQYTLGRCGLAPKQNTLKNFLL